MLMSVILFPFKLVKDPLNMDTFYGHVSVRIKGV